MPKCGGTSMIEYISSLDSNIAVCFNDDTYFSRPSERKWSMTSPQHIDGNSLSRLFPAEFIDEFLAVVRNPICRLKSAFTYQKLVEGNINYKTTIDQFIKEELIFRYLDLGWMDNHFLPQVLLLYPGVSYSLFKIESNGLNHMKDCLDYIFFGKNSDKSLPHSNKSETNIPISHLPATTKLSDESVELVYQLYQADYHSFNYKYPEQE